METNNLGKQSSTLFWKGSTLQLLDVIIFPLAILVLIFALGGAFANQPLRDLEKMSARLAWGNFQAVDEPVGGIMEIRRLQAEMAQMAHKVQAAQNNLLAPA